MKKDKKLIVAAVIVSVLVVSVFIYLNIQKSEKGGVDLKFTIMQKEDQHPEIINEFEKEFSESFYSPDRAVSIDWYCEKKSANSPLLQEKIIFRCQRGSELVDMVGTKDELLTAIYGSSLAMYRAWANKTNSSLVEGYLSFSAGGEKQSNFTNEELRNFFNEYEMLFLSQLKTN